MMLCALSSICMAEFEKDLQLKLILAEPGDTIRLDSGLFPILGTLSMEGKRDVVIKGTGMNSTILNFSTQVEGAQGLSITNCKNIILEDFTVQDAKGDAIKCQYTDGITFRRVKAQWLGGPQPTNGAYGLYPVQCENVLVEHCIAVAASDAGIYVGQSKDIIVRFSEAFDNVAGIEIENSTRADGYGNNVHGNTGGILVFDLPDLPVKEGRQVRIFDNIIKDNNLDNFAPEGNIVGKVPAGTGIIAGGAIRSVCEVLGIQDVVAKSLGSSNPHNVLKACVNGLRSQNSPKILSAIRGKKISDIVLKREEK